MQEIELEDINPDLISQLASNAENGRKALERHPDSPFEQSWARDNVEHYEKSAGSAHVMVKPRDYEELVGFEGLEGASNPHGVINKLLKKPVGCDSLDNLGEAIWDLADQDLDYNHPGRQNGYDHPQDVLMESSDLASFLEYALGYSDKSGSGIEPEVIQQMAYRADIMEDYFDSLMTSI